MFFIPGIIIAAVTFPGVIVHEFAHQLFCRLTRTAVLEVCYFRIGNPAGFVKHEHPSKPAHQVWIAIGPFFVNTIIGALLALPAFLPVVQFESATLLDYILFWLGISIAMHAFPSTGDAANVWSLLKRSETPFIVKLIGAPIVGLINLGAIGSFFWLDLIYGVAIAALLPNLLVHAIV